MAASRRYRVLVVVIKQERWTRGAWNRDRS